MRIGYRTYLPVNVPKKELLALAYVIGAVDVSAQSVHAEAMSESPPPTQPRQRQWRPPGPPDNEIPRSASVNTVLGRGPDAALFLGEAQAYTTGVLFFAALRLRRRFDSHGTNMHMELMGSPTGNSGADDPDGRLMLGVQLSDGRRTLMTTGFLPVTQADAPADPGALSLTSTPGGGFIGDVSSDVRYWLRPLPPSGPLLFVIRWLALGIEETVTELDGSAIAAAGALATALWPPVTPQGREPPPPPPRPASGWFAEAID